ncbi:MAG: DUF2617 family protein, partial [Myxococcota bacterium]|nr:DUF2617 family protein [Myxococcota bacterium]
MRFSPQIPEDLTFAHFTTGASLKSFDPGRFRSYQSERRTFSGGLSLEATIIGESHHVQVGGALSFVELLACVDAREHGLDPAHWSRDIDAEPSWTYQTQGWEVRAQLSRFEATRDRRVEICEQAVQDSDFSLQQVFPGPAEPRT